MNFLDLIPEELPKELPPMQDIRYAIDLVRGAPLPNLLAYYITQVNNCQVDDFL